MRNLASKKYGLDKHYAGAGIGREGEMEKGGRAGGQASCMDMLIGVDSSVVTLHMRNA